MEYSFDIDEAIEYGVDEAIMIKNFKFWINKNKVNKVNFYDGRTWTFNSEKAFTEFFPFWSKKQIRRILKSLIEKEILITGNFNKLFFDRTTWYAFNNEEKFLKICNLPNENMEITKSEHYKLPNGNFTNDQMVTPIPDSKPYNKPDIKHTVIFTPKNFIDEILHENKIIKILGAVDRKEDFINALKKESNDLEFNTKITARNFVNDYIEENIWKYCNDPDGDKYENKSDYEYYNKKLMMGEFKNIPLTKYELDKLMATWFHNQPKLEEGIEILSDYVESTGKKYKNYYAVLRKNNWVYNKVWKKENR